MTLPLREFWLDVGGTFTDCFCHDSDGSIRRHKILSTGVTKGECAPGSHTARILDPARRADPERFWEGYELRLVGPDGTVVDRGWIAGFDRAAGTLEFVVPLTVAPETGMRYELASSEEAPLVAIRYLLGLRRDQAIPAVSVRLGTTRGTNSLLTRRGARTAFVTTRGFGDVLAIGYQNRPKLFELAIHKRVPLYCDVVEIEERITPTGEVLCAPLEERIRQQLSQLRAAGCQSLAVCLLHAFDHPEHELIVERIARDVGFEEVSLSSRVAPLIKIVARGDTTLVDAYLNPILRAYVDHLRAGLGASALRIMTSAGGLVEASQFVGKESILSGPAGGVVGFARVAQNCGFERAIGFDMGGTSTDVSRFDGGYEFEYETEKAGVRVVAPMLKIETVAAGGGSICSFDGVKLVVGPDSSGADPGPACYGRGGPLAVTDLNFILGKVPPQFFPFPLDRRAVVARLAELAAQIRQATGQNYSATELADGFLRVANSNMVRAIRSVSIAQGVDPREYVLVAFGGAAGQHACAVARELGMRQILIHPDAGLLSAYGIGLADVTRHRAIGVYLPYSEDTVQGLETTFARLADEARAAVLAEGIPAERITVRRVLELRYRGVDAALAVSQPEPAAGSYAEAFARQHQRLYGYTQPERPLEIVSARVEVAGRTATAAAPSASLPPVELLSTTETTTAWFDAQPRETLLLDRAHLILGQRIQGPAIVREQSSTTVIDPGWVAEVLSGGELLLADQGTHPRAAVSTTADPVMLEVFNNLFAGIAEQMGITLRNTSASVNVKERLDFSCALFTARGELVVNAPHIPVHLGAMGQTVRAIIAHNARIEPGDVYVTNDPYQGGSHLPDVTVITPVHDPASGRLIFFTASRAHHAEIGGIVPGSMPPFSRNLAEEGVLIRNFKLVSGGHERFAALAEMLAAPPYPSRKVDENLADIAAAVAANRQGAGELERLIERYSLPVVEAYMRHIQDAAERRMRLALAKLPPGRREFLDYLDDGTPIAVAVTIVGDAATIDFAGTGPVLAGNLNANRAIVTAAVLYCLRLLIDEEIPLNEGVLAPVTIVVPEGSLLAPPQRATPAECAAVVGGNVETSQRIVDVVLGALGIAAASQGTMNNLLFGDATFGYYETICGGSGATADEPGADAVHTHMTNTRLTDPEVLERRTPVRLHEFSIRRGSGGEGLHPGGAGVVRKLEFLRELDVSILSQRRGPYPPYGQHGGAPGALGRNTIYRADGSEETLPNQAQLLVRPGDVLVIETPGGGGFGTARPSAREV
ncbi:MAG: hydantoinase B/oxoprolinase family protein [Planctomycetaceae bacterium]|nr:hydantoinase B/oxoprolinase family protein [Planctomycetaceae bacterium]